jgi:cytoskeletal protein RodZ
MDQVSRPMLLALLATVGLAGVWMVALRPKADAGGATPAPAAQAPKAPGTAGLGRAIDHAKDAVGASQTSAAQAEGATKAASEGAAKAAPAAAAMAVAPKTRASKPTTARTKTRASKPTTARTKSRASQPATSAVKAPASQPAVASPNAAASTPAADAVLRELARGEAVVLLFAGDGADDAAAKRAVVAARGKRVAVHVAPLSRLGDYRAILADTEVLSAPTVLVIGPDRKARAITGVTEAGEVRAAVADALHA